MRRHTVRWMRIHQVSENGFLYRLRRGRSTQTARRVYILPEPAGLISASDIYGLKEETNGQSIRNTNHTASE